MTDPPAPSTRRRTVKRIAVAMAALTSVMYFLIGFQVLTVLEHPEDQTAFGFIAGAAFLGGALVIQFFDRHRVLMGLGALSQGLIILTYFNLAAQREPSFEVWGIVIRVIQVLLLGALIYLAARPPVPAQPIPGPRSIDRVSVTQE